MPDTVVTGSSSDTPRVGSIFEGLNFFVQRIVPARSQLINDIKANGGRVLKHERDADLHIADHMKSDAPDGSYSYTLIKAALKNGTMPVSEEMASHATGTRSAVRRPVGSIVPAKSTRNPFTSQDDRILRDWVKQAEVNGESATGIAMYRPLAEAHPQHTVHSWRDRYVKRLMTSPPQATEPMVSANPPPSPPVTAADSVFAEPAVPSRKRRKIAFTGNGVKVDQEKPNFKTFTQVDFDTLLDDAADVEAIGEGRHKEAWREWHAAHPQHTAGEWRQFYEATVRPEFLRRQAAVAGVQDSSPQDNVQNRNEHDIQSTAVPTDHWSNEEENVKFDGMARGWNSKQVQKRPSQSESSLAHLKDPDEIRSTDQNPSDDPSAAENGGEGTIEPQGLALTEANLAGQQWQHNLKITRGNDIKEDDLMRGQNRKRDELSAPEDEQQYDKMELRDGQLSGPEDDEQYAFDEGTLLVPEPEGGFDYAGTPRMDSTPAHRSRPGTQDRSPVVNLLNRFLPQHHANASRAEIETFELSSANPPSSSYEGSRYSQEPDEDEAAGGPIVDTQDILNAAIQDPDLHIPLPSSLIVDSEGGAPKEQGRTISIDERPLYDARAEQDSDDDDAPDVDTWMSRMRFRGFAEASVVEALKCTCLRLDLARVVLLEERAGKGFPDDIPGVWSQMEDEWLEGSDARKIRRLQEKHGADEVDLRLKFLQNFRDEDEDEDDA